MKKLVIFDMDGLMFDSERLSGECLIQAGKHYGYTISWEDRLELLGKNKETNSIFLKKHYGKDMPVQDIFAYSEQLRNQYIDKYGVKMKKGLVELLDYLSSQHVLLAIASSSSKELIGKYLDLHQIKEYFNCIISGEMVSRCKPDPEMFLAACRYFGIDTKDAIVLEDSVSGIQAALHADIDVICVPDLVMPEEKYVQASTACLHDLLEVKEYFEKN